MPPENHYEELITKLLDDELDATSRAQLLESVRNDPAFKQQLAEHLAISEALSRRQAERSDEVFLKSTVNHVLALDKESENAFVTKIQHHIQKRRNYQRLAIAAALLLCTTATFLFVRNRIISGNSFATMVEVDRQGRVISTREISSTFRHTADHGLFRLNFDNGAVVAIEAPADFKVLSPRAMQLSSGRLNAWCPEAAHGFQVVTATGTVTDLGTSFGVSTTKNSGSNFLVLEGLIEVNQGKEVKRLKKGEAVRTDATPGIKDLKFQTAEFGRTWPLASGILSTVGSVAAAPPGTAEQLSTLRDDSTVLVIPEKRNIPFNHSFQAELVDPGTFPGTDVNAVHTVQATSNTRLKSYLVRYNPKSPKTTKDIFFRRFEGEVTFDRPVKAICCQGKYLEAGDPTFATGNWTNLDEVARKFRGIDIDQPKEFPDEIRLSEDRRTVHVIFNACLSSDDIRVIIEED